MKKLLMLGAILVLGATAFAADQSVDGNANINEAKVTVKAHLVAQNLVVSDLEGNPIVLDFGKVSKTRDKGTSEARTGYKVRYVGGELTADQNLAMELKGTVGNYAKRATTVTLAEVSQKDKEKADKFDVTVGLDSYAGKMPAFASKPGDADYSEYTGTVFGTLDHANANPVANGIKAGKKLADLTSGDYIGYATLKVTINDGNEIK